MDDRELSKRLDNIEQLLIEISYELNILDEENQYITREERELIIEENEKNINNENKLDAKTYKNPGKYQEPIIQENEDEEDEEEYIKWKLLNKN